MQDQQAIPNSRPTHNQPTKWLAHQVINRNQTTTQQRNQPTNKLANQPTTAAQRTQINTNFCIIISILDWWLITAEVSGNVFFNELQGRIQGNLAEESMAHSYRVLSQPKLPQTPKRKQILKNWW